MTDGPFVFAALHPQDRRRFVGAGIGVRSAYRLQLKLAPGASSYELTDCVICHSTWGWSIRRYTSSELITTRRFPDRTAAANGVAARDAHVAAVVDGFCD